MKIGELAERTGASVRSLRYYEQQQLLRSSRTGGGHRVFEEDSVERVQVIQVLLAAGVPSHHVGELLPCIYSGTTTASMVHRLVAERERIQQRVEELATTVRRLDEVIVQARSRQVDAA